MGCPGEQDMMNRVVAGLYRSSARLLRKMAVGDPGSSEEGV